MEQPPEHCSHTEGVETRSKGRERNRYAAEVSAPTGQIWMVLPEKYDWKGSPSPVPTCWSAPRSISSIIGSPATWLENRVQRAQSTHRSRSSRTWVEIGTGFSKVRFFPSNRESAPPCDIAWFWSGHSPPLSQTGQSSGWLISSSSITPFCAFSATGEVICDLTTMPSVQVMVQEAIGLRWPSTSTMHWRQAPAGSRSGWSQKRGISMPRSSAARMTRVPLGTLISMPSMVSVTRSSGGTAASPPPEGALVVTVMRSPPGERSCRRCSCRRPRPWTGRGRRGSPCR
ncbi:hypothetical protein SCALM49S_08424 [Streptomyces californicus]